MKPIVSALPGRLRVKDPRFASDEAAASFALRLRQAAADGSRLKTRINTGATSVIVEYDVGAMSLSAAVSLVEQLLPATPGGRALPGRRRSRRMRFNRYAKIGALGSLVASTGFAAIGHKRLHVATGMAFLAFLSAHLIIFRRTLVR